MTLSENNQLLKFFDFKYTQNNCNELTKDIHEVFSAFGKVSLIHIDDSNKRTYEIKLKFQPKFENFHNILISNHEKTFQVINIHMNAKTTIIKCHEYSENIV